MKCTIIAEYAEDGRLAEPLGGQHYEWLKMIDEVEILGRSLTKEELTNTVYDVAQGSKNTYFRNDRLDMNQLLEKFPNG